MPAVATLWNEILPPQGFPCARLTGKDRVAALRQRLAEEPARQTLAWWRGYFEAIAARDWCRGGNDRNWWANLTYALRPGHCRDYEEGAWNRQAPIQDPTR